MTEKTENAGDGPAERGVRLGFWPSVIDGMGLGPLWRWLAERRRKREWSAERQLHELRVIVMMDHRWLAHDETASALTHRYLKLLDEHWYKQTTEDVSDLRKRLGLCPHEARHKRIERGEPLYSDGPLPERGWD